MTDILTVDTMSKQEREYLNDMAKTAVAWLNAVEALQQLTNDEIKENPLDSQLSNFSLRLTANYESSQKLHQWADANLQMDRFPANNAELNVALSIVEAGKGEAWYLQECYRNIVGSTGYFKKFMTIANKIRQIRHNTELLHALLFRAEGAVSVNDCSIDPSLLFPLPVE